MLNDVTYEDATSRHEYVVFSDSARRSAIPQYLDNRQLYGYLTFDAGDDHYVIGGIEPARALLEAGATTAPPQRGSPSSSTHAAPADAAPDHNQPLVSIEQVHLINLDRSTDRLAKFRARNAHLTNILRVPAIDGASINREYLIQNGTIAADLGYSPGALGCALSHVEVWKMAISDDRVVTVFEDDVVCSHAFSRESARIVSNLPADWDFIQWGYNYEPSYLWVAYGFSKAKICFYDCLPSQDHEKFQQTTFSWSAVGLVHSFGTQGYSVSPKGAIKLLEGCLPLRKRQIALPGTDVVTEDAGIDAAMCAIYASMRAFVCVPPLLIHDRGQASTIQD